MNRVIGKIVFILCGLILTAALGCSQVNAAGPQISLYPNSGYAVLNKDFAVDIMIDTEGESTTETHVVLKFDQSKIQVTKAQQGDLYCQYPDDGYSVNNTQGTVQLSGFCLDPYYQTSSQAEIFGRITFEPLVEGEVKIDFEFDGTEDEWKTYVKNNGSPPQNILTDFPEGGTYTVVSQVPSGTSSSSSSGSKLPGVGIFDNKLMIFGYALVGSGLLVLVGSYIFKKVRNFWSSRDERTVVV